LSRSIFRIGTRGSILALKQSDKVMTVMQALFPDLELQRVIIKTRGDRILDSPLSMIGGKGLFIREIEEALHREDIDLAVHSLKDLPTELPDGFCLGGVLKRGDPRDALVCKDNRRLQDLGEGDSIATSSLRRRAQLLHLRPGIRVVDIRGNVDTRLRKMEDGHSTAIILAACGLHRAGLDDKITEYLDPKLFLPAAGQGIIALEIRQQDRQTAVILDKLNDPLSLQAGMAERNFLRLLEGGCQIPIGCLCNLNGNHCTIRGMLSDVEGARVIQKTVSGPAAASFGLAEQLATDILKAGGEEILHDLRHHEQIQ
jgi:hydroxymethylbilane synthase